MKISYEMLECREQKREKMGVSKERNGYWKGKGKGNLFFWAAKFDRLWSKLTFDQKRSKLLFSTKHGRTYQATGNGRNYIIDIIISTGLNFDWVRSNLLISTGDGRN